VLINARKYSDTKGRSTDSVEVKNRSRRTKLGKWNWTIVCNISTYFIFGYFAQVIIFIMIIFQILYQNFSHHIKPHLWPWRGLSEYILVKFFFLEHLSLNIGW